MKFYKKATLSVAMLAMLGGLAGCGSQNAHHSNNQATSSSESNDQYFAHKRKINDEENHTLASTSAVFKQTSPLEKKYSDDINIKPGNVTIHGKTYASNTFNLYKMPKGVKPDSMTDQGPSNNALGDDTKDYNYKLPYKDVFKAFWHDTYRGISKHKLNKYQPGVFVYRYINGNPEDTRTDSSAIYYAFTNSPKLHIASKGQFKSEGSGSY